VTTKDMRVILFAGILLAFFASSASGESRTRQQQAAPQTPTAAVDIKALQQKADQSDAKAQCELGINYFTGRGVTRDASQAVTWLRKSADQGYAVAQFNLGGAYDSGVGVPQDYRQAAFWYGKAAEQGHAGAQPIAGKGSQATRVDDGPTSPRGELQDRGPGQPRPSGGFASGFASPATRASRQRACARRT
jgi:hypothetical protein